MQCKVCSVKCAVPTASRQGLSFPDDKASKCCKNKSEWCVPYLVQLQCAVCCVNCSMCSSQCEFSTYSALYNSSSLQLCPTSTVDEAGYSAQCAVHTMDKVFSVQYILSEFVQCALYTLSVNWLVCNTSQV